MSYNRTYNIANGKGKGPGHSGWEKTMSYAIFQQGIVTSKRMVPGKIIASGIETVEEAYQVRHDLAVDGVYSSGHEWSDAAYDEYLGTMQVIRLS